MEAGASHEEEALSLCAKDNDGIDSRSATCRQVRGETSAGRYGDRRNRERIKIRGGEPGNLCLCQASHDLCSGGADGDARAEIARS